MPITIQPATLKVKKQNGQYQSADCLKGDKGDPGSVGIIAPDYANLTFPVAQGQPCIHEGLYYIANSAIQSSESWTAAHWTQLTVGEQVTSVLNDIQGIHQIPSGGSSGQVLKRASGTDYDVAWGTEQGGGSQITGSDAVSKTINEIQYRKYYKIDKSMMVSGSYGTSSMGVTPSPTHIRTPIAIYFPKYAHLYIETFGNAEKVYIGRYTLNGSWIGEKSFTPSTVNKTYFSDTDQYIVVDFQGFASPDNCTTVVYVAYVSDYEILNPSDVINGTSNQDNSEYYFTSSTKTLLSIWQFKVKAYDVFRFKSGTNIHRVYVEYLDPSTMKTGQGMNTGWIFDGGRVIVPSDYIATVFFKNTENTDINPSNYDAEFVLEQPSVQRERIELEYGSYASDSNRTFGAVYNGYYNAKRNILFLDIEDTLGVLPSDNLKNTTVYVMFYDIDQNFISSKNFTGKMINVPSGAKYIGIYSENLNIESVEVSLYGCTKKPHFVKRMARQGAFPTNPSENLIFPVTKTTFSKLRLILPSTYKSEGTPTPLIVWMRGSHYQTSWDDEFAATTNPSIANYIAYLRDEGFAVCQMKTWGSYYISKYGDNVENASPYSVPTCINTFIKGIEYLTSRYNIDPNNIHLLGHSQAGQFQTYCVTFPPVPIKSICMFSPVCDSLSMPGSYLYADTRKCIAEDLDLDGDLTYYTGTSFSTYSTEGIAFLTANADKMRRKNEAFTGLIGGTPADWFADGIADGSAFWSGGTAHPELTNIYTHYDYAKLANVPVKIWGASDDDSTPYRKMVEVVKQWQNTGGEAIMRTMPDNTGGHHAAAHGNVMSESVTTSTGVVYNDLPIAWYEAVRFMKQHMGK